MNPVIGLDSVSHTFRGPDREVVALDGVGLEVAPGELVALRGPSGSGKTTLLFATGAMRRPDAGSVTVAGTDVYSLSAAGRARFRAATIGFVFQTFHLVPYLDAIDNVRLAGRGASISRGEAERALARVGLAARASHRPDQLSVGERQRVALARALVKGPAVLLADEPTGNLDPTRADAVLDLLDAFRDDGGTVLLVTHGAEIDRRASRVLTLEDGRLGSTTDTNRSDAPA